VIIGTAGHIDHGKTALVRALTGVDTDRLPEEKRRGITIELGFAPLDLPGAGRVGIVDVPGHEAFVRTMVAGATGIDLGLLVVAADEGVMPQTREHLAILSLLGLRAGIVVLTKCDLVDRDWLDLVREDLGKLVSSTPLETAPIVETSVRDGRGIAELKQIIDVELSRFPPPGAADLFRLPIDRAFSMKGTGTVVTGTAWSGRVTVGSELHLFPADRRVRVRGLQVHGEATHEGVAGSRVAVALTGAEVAEIQRGSLLVDDEPWVPTTRFLADVVLDSGSHPFRAREWVQLHVGTVETAARVVVARAPVGPGGHMAARVVTEAPVVLRAGDRFVLRRSQPLGTIGGGRVVDPAPVHRRTRPVDLWDDDPATRVGRLVAESGPAGIAVASLPIRAGVPRAAAPAVVRGVHDAVEISGRLYLQSVLDRVAERIEEAVVAYHRSNPLEGGMPQSRLRAASGEAESLTDGVLASVVANGRLEIFSGLVRQRGWRPQVSRDTAVVRDWILQRIRGAGLEPPSVGELQAEQPGANVLQILRMLEAEAKVVAVESDRYFARQALEGAIARLRSAMGDGGVYAPSQLREALGVSRKYLMPLLEYCDRRRITERHPDGRVLAEASDGRLA
jgi:selenocysteine-specific elongation factor